VRVKLLYFAQYHQSLQIHDGQSLDVDGIDVKDDGSLRASDACHINDRVHLSSRPKRARVAADFDKKTSPAPSEQLQNAAFAAAAVVPKPW
jgi:hypothetical protein